MKKIFVIEGRTFIGNEVKVNASGSQRKYSFYISAGSVMDVVTAIKNRMTGCIENLEDALLHNQVLDIETVDGEIRNYVYNGKDGYTHHFSIPAYNAMENAIAVLEELIKGHNEIDVHDITRCDKLGWLEVDQIVKACMEFPSVFNPFWLELLEKRIQELKN